MPTLKAAAAFIASCVVMVATVEVMKRIIPRIEERTAELMDAATAGASRVSAALQFEATVRDALPGALWEAWIACHDAAEGSNSEA